MPRVIGVSKDDGHVNGVALAILPRVTRYRANGPACRVSR